jgi:thiol:disulfide interchange protein DsbA
MQATSGRVAFLTAFLMLLAGSPALQAQPVSPNQFVELAPPVPVTTGERIEVIEFFYYGCPVCYEAQPHIARWLQKSGNDVVLRRVPAVSADGWEPFARSFYTLEAMGLLARLHWPVYDNFHFDGKRLNEEDVMADWIASNGGDGAKFRAIWDSAEVKSKVGAAHEMLDAYQVRGVPSLVIDGKFVTSARMAGSVQQMMVVVEQLVERARAERGKK